MTGPFFLIEHGDVSAFGSIESLLQYVEPVDVRNDEYSAYDAEGCRLTLGVIEDRTILRAIERVVLEARVALADPAPNRPHRPTQ
jgi:hypothetical protein